MEDVIIGFIGFGLIGGSIAKALRELYPDCKLIAYNYYKGKPNLSLEQARDDKVLNKITNELYEEFPNCDIIFLCAPVLTNINYLRPLKEIIKSTCILTDVGSVKGNIHQAIEELKLETNFIGGHPMAGSEKTGYKHSHARLLENAYYILTPTLETPKKMLDRMHQLVGAIGAIPIILNQSEHDDITAAISHVPHIIASSLVNIVRFSDDSSEKMRSLAAGGFKDITRIASSSPEMWQNICLTNTKSIKKFLTSYIGQLTEVCLALDKMEEEYLYHFFETAKEYRDSIPNKSIGPIPKIYAIYVDLIDEAGAIATIATILASNHISIKNIGIIHNREFQEGALRIEFYEEVASKQAICLLKKYSYIIYER